jgi:hypothetical protein
MSVTVGNNERILLKNEDAVPTQFSWPPEQIFSFYIEQLTIHLESPFTLLGYPTSLYINSPDGLGGWYRTLLYQRDFGVDGSTNILWLPEQPIYVDIGERLEVISLNPEDIVAITRIVLRR